jgi:zinc transport system substrate-binding protein
MTGNRKAKSMRSILALLLTSTMALAEVPRVVTDIPPVHSIVAMVMGDLGTPELLLGKGADEHDFQLKPSQMTALSEAGLVVWIGPELTPWLDSALEARSGEGAVLTLFDDVGTYKINYFVSAQGEEDHVEGAVEEGHDDHDHGAGSIDPHVWLDPSTAQWWTGLIAAELSRLDPENAATYAANAETSSAAIAKAEVEAKALLEPVKDRPFVTFHDAYGYYITYFGLTPAGTIAHGDAASPGAARLSELRAKLEAGGVVCIFPEVQHDPALVRQMAEGAGVRVGGALDPVGSSLEPGPGAYAALMTGMARTIADCAGG